MGWYPKKRKTRGRKISKERNKFFSVQPGLSKFAHWLASLIAAAEKRDPELQRLKKTLAALPKVREVEPLSLVDVEHSWRMDVTMGRSTSYYAIEEEVLLADLPRVAASHNRAVVEAEIERRRRELAWEVAQKFWPIWALDEKERQAVLAMAGIGPPLPPGPACLPLETAARYRAVVKQPQVDGDDWEPDPEVLEAMEGWKTVFSEEGQWRAAVAEAGSGGRLEKGRKLNVMYGSTGMDQGAFSFAARGEG